MIDLAAKFDSGLTYESFLSTYATDDQKQRWQGLHDRVRLSDAQRTLLSGFTRDMKILVLAGAWCGDCVNQCPVFDHFASVCDRVQVRFFDRDDNCELGELLSTCGAPRVPSVLFLSEDHHVCGRYGDRTLTKYRDMAATQLGEACPSGIAADDVSLLEQVTQEWLNEFERIQLMLRLSGRLRRLHND